MISFSTARCKNDNTGHLFSVYSANPGYISILEADLIDKLFKAYQILLINKVETDDAFLMLFIITLLPNNHIHILVLLRPKDSMRKHNKVSTISLFTV